MSCFPSRRTFLKTTSMAFPAVIGLNSHVKARAAQEGKLGVALCGLGGFSRQSIAPELPLAEKVYFAGVITGDPAKGREWAALHGFSEKNIFRYAEMARLADCDEIKIVHVVTPNSLHASHSIAAAKAGKHVLCEKPMATSSAQCEAMIAAAQQAGVLLGVNYRLLWEPHHLKAVEALRAGAVGDLSNGNYEFSWGYASFLADPVKRRNIKQWLLDPEMAGGGAMFDTGVYPVQAACSLTGKTPVSVRAFPATRHPALFPEGVEETMSFELLFEDGFQALCRASYSNSFHQCTTLGPKGMVEVLPGSPGSVYGQSSDGKPSAKRLLINRKEEPLGDTLQLARLHDEFAASILTQTPFKADGAMGLRDIRIIEAVYASARQGGTCVDVHV